MNDKENVVYIHEGMVFTNEENDILPLADTWMKMENSGLTAASQARRFVLLIHVPRSCTTEKWVSPEGESRVVALGAREHMGWEGEVGERRWLTSTEVRLGQKSNF